MSALPSKADVLGVNWASEICKPTARDMMVLDTTDQDVQQKNPEREHTLSYWAELVGTIVLELENR